MILLHAQVGNAISKKKKKEDTGLGELQDETGWSGVISKLLAWKPVSRQLLSK